MSDLFDIPENLSPYLQWERDNRIKTHHSSDPGLTPWIACQSDYSVAEHCGKFGEEGTGEGETKEEAINDLVKKSNIKPFGADRIGGGKS